MSKKKGFLMEFGLFLSFLGFFFTAVILVVAFLYLYALVTPYDDYNLIFEKNNIDFFKLKHGSHKKVWWRCENSHVYEAAINSRACHGSGCPYCNRHKKDDSVDITHPHLLDMWDYNKNII